MKQAKVLSVGPASDIKLAEGAREVQSQTRPMMVELPAANSYTPMPVEAQPTAGSYTPMPIEAQPATNSYTRMPVEVQPPMASVTMVNARSYTPSPVSVAGAVMPRSASFVPSVASGAPPTMTVLPTPASFSMIRSRSLDGAEVVLPRVNSFTGAPLQVQTVMPIEVYDRSGTKVFYAPTPIPRQVSLTGDLPGAPMQVLPSTVAAAPTGPGQAEEEESEEEEEGVLDTLRNLVTSTSEIVKSTAVTAAATVQARAADLGPMISSSFQSPLKERPAAVSFVEGANAEIAPGSSVPAIATSPVITESAAASLLVQRSAPVSMQAAMPEAATSRTAPPSATPVLEDGKLWMQHTLDEEELRMWRQKAPVGLWLVDNHTLQGKTPGLGLRSTMDINNKDGQACIPWGSIVEARSCSQDWLETMTFKGVRYLPRYILGVQVLTPYSSLVENEERALPAPTSQVIPVMESTMAKPMPQTVPNNLSAAVYPSSLTNMRPAASAGQLSPLAVNVAPYAVEQSSAPFLKAEEAAEQANGEMSKLFSTVSGVFVGSMGIVCNTKTGLIREVMDGQAKKVGVRPGWTIKKIADESYNDGVMVKALDSKKPYQVTFEVPFTNLQVPILAPESVANEPPQTYTAGAGYDVLPETVSTSMTYPSTVLSPRDGGFPQTRSFSPEPGLRSARVLGVYNSTDISLQYGSSPMPSSAIIPGSLDTQFATQYSPRYLDPTRTYTTGSTIAQQEMFSGGNVVQNLSGSAQPYGIQGSTLSFQGAPSPISQTLPVSALGATSFVEDAPGHLLQGAPSLLSHTQGAITLDGLGETQDLRGRPII